MNILFNEKHQRTDVYNYEINTGGEFGIFLPADQRQVAILFKNNKFSEARYGWSGCCDRNGWRILAAIEAKITELEGRYKDE